MGQNDAVCAGQVVIAACGLVGAGVLFYAGYRACLKSGTLPIHGRSYKAKLYCSAGVAAMFIGLCVIALAYRPSIAQEFEAVCYAAATIGAALFYRKEHRDIGRATKYSKIFWSGLCLSEILTTILVGVNDGGLYMYFYTFILLGSIANAILMIFLKENVTEKLIYEEALWSKFETMESSPAKQKKLWQNIYDISVSNFIIEEDQSVYFIVIIHKGQKREEIIKVKRMAVEFSSIHEEFRSAHSRSKVPALPPKIPQRLQFNERVLEEKQKSYQELLKFLLAKKFKRLLEFINPLLPFYGSNNITQEMSEEVPVISEEIEEEKVDEVDEVDEVKSMWVVEIVGTHEVGTIKKYTVYAIEARCNGNIFHSSHRFSDFKKLHQEIIRIIPTLGELPSSSMMTFSTSVDVVTERKKCLEKYLQGILQIEELQGYRSVIEFLNLHPAID